MEKASVTSQQQQQPKKGFYFDFIGNRNIAFIVSIVTIVLGIGSVLFRGGFDLSIEFAGGTLVEIRFSELPQVEKIRSAMESAGFKEAVIQRVGDEHTVLIRISNLEAAAVQGGQQTEQDMGKKILAILQSTTGDAKLEVRRVEQIGPQVGDELKRSAQLALLFAIGGMILYIAWRFEAKFAWPIALIGIATIGVTTWHVPLTLVIIASLVVLLIASVFFKYHFSFAAIIALIHDVFVTVGALSLMNYEMNLTVVAAILTIIGYSVNDTIVIFDRIRENLRLMRGKPTLQILNDSVNQTLSRTLLTGMTAIFCVSIFLWFGGPAIKGFSFAMLVGIITGTYSSVFVATPILYVWDKAVKGVIFKKA
jgi:preprotein translocase subunit SecF